jgi:hypothetical protein
MSRSNARPAAFADLLQELEARTLDVQLRHFKMPPQRRGRLFYALELVGEMGELLNSCKKFLRTNVAQRRNAHARTHIPREAADTLIGLMLLKLAAGDQRPARPRHVDANRSEPAAKLHTHLSALASACTRLYAREVGCLSGRPQPAFALPTYARAVAELRAVATCFNFDLAAATRAKLDAIIRKVAAGYYD